MSSRVRPDGAAALLAGGPVRARRARCEVDGRRFFVDKGQFTADVRAVVVTVRGILDHFAQQGASGHGMVFAQNRCHASLVAGTPVRDLLLRAKYLFVAAILARTTSEPPPFLRERDTNGLALGMERPAFANGILAR